MLFAMDFAAVLEDEDQLVLVAMERPPSRVVLGPDADGNGFKIWIVFELEPSHQEGPISSRSPGGQERLSAFFAGERLHAIRFSFRAAELRDGLVVVLQ
jgi:hypothetical protein